MLDALRVASALPLGRGQYAARLCCPRSGCSGVDYYTGGHPLPNQDSFASAAAALRLLQQTGPRDFVFFLISGGGSAMFELPLDARISLEETQALYQALVGSGATIAEINTVRKHFSAVKGGRLAAAAPQAARFSLLVSDVAPSISMPWRPVPRFLTRPRWRSAARFSSATICGSAFPQRCRPSSMILRLPETPSLPEAPVEILLSSDDLIDAARVQAIRLGYEVVIDNSCDDWDYADAARYLLDRFDQLRSQHRRLCLLSGGEVTVRLGREHGAGGRNQQFALACALELVERGSMVVLSAGSDGIDGNSTAAGAIADATTVARSQALGIDAASALARFDAYPLFTALGDTLVTGPTHNNLRDLRILLSS